MHTRTTTAAILLAAGLTLTACSSDGHDAAPAATTAPPAVSDAPTVGPTPVELSTEWVPKIEILTSGTGVSDCASDSGSDGCVQGIANSVGLLDQITKAIRTADATGEYPKTIDEITKLLNAADAYDTDQCGGDPNADVDGSPCPKNAIAVTVGMTKLEFVMQTDEANAGIA